MEEGDVVNEMPLPGIEAEFPFEEVVCFKELQQGVHLRVVDRQPEVAGPVLPDSLRHQVVADDRLLKGEVMFAPV